MAVRPRDALPETGVLEGRCDRAGDELDTKPFPLHGIRDREVLAQGPPPEAHEVQAVEVLPADRPCATPEEVVPVAEEDVQARRVPRRPNGGPHPPQHGDVPPVARRRPDRREGEGLDESSKTSRVGARVGVEEDKDLIRRCPSRQPAEESEGLPAEARAIPCEDDLRWDAGADPGPFNRSDRRILEAVDAEHHAVRGIVLSNERVEVTFELGVCPAAGHKDEDSRGERTVIPHACREDVSSEPEGEDDRRARR